MGPGAVTAGDGVGVETEVEPELTGAILVAMLEFIMLLVELGGTFATLDMGPKPMGPRPAPIEFMDEMRGWGSCCCCCGWERGWGLLWE